MSSPEGTSPVPVQRAADPSVRSASAGLAGAGAPELAPLDVVARTLEHPESLQLHVQPIVDLVRAQVAGYEALSRFGPGVRPDLVFAAAEDAGLGGALDAIVLTRAVGMLPDLPGNAFLTVNTGPERWVDESWLELVVSLGSRPRGLQRLVVELTEHVPFSDLDAVRDGVDTVRGLGGMVALDDAGTGYSGLVQLARLRPDIVKLDRELVSGVDSDPVKSALVELLGSYAGRLDAWLLAEGIETENELAEVMRLGVPLAQGYLLGRPAPALEPLAPHLRAMVAGMAQRLVLEENVTALMRSQATRPVAAPLPAVVEALTVLVDAAGAPVELAMPSAAAQRTAVSLRCHASEPVAEVARRAMSRPAHQRFDPVVVIDPRGVHLGVVLIEDLVRHLARTVQA